MRWKKNLKNLDLFKEFEAYEETNQIFIKSTKYNMYKTRRNSFKLVEALKIDLNMYKSIRNIIGIRT